MRRVTLVCLAIVGACGPEPADSTSGSDTLATTGASGSTGGSSGSSSGVSETGSTATTAPTTGGSSSTGAMGVCEPSGGPVPEDQFAVRFAEAVCAQKAACDCEVPPDCVESFTAQFAAVQQFAVDNGLHYIAERAGDLLVDAIEGRACAKMSQIFDNFMCPSTSYVFRGDVPTGAECPNYPPDVSAYCDGCAVEGEYCHFGDTIFCGPPIEYPTVGEGEACLSPNNNTIASCEGELTCNPYTGVCHVPAAEGEACGLFAECASPLWCDAQGTCRAQKPDGATCQDSWECNATCDNGVCGDFVIICRVDEPSDLIYSFTL